MRAIFVAAILLCAASAQAQTAAPITGFGPLSFGMSQAETRAVKASGDGGGVLTLPRTEGGGAAPTSDVTGPALMIGGDSFDTKLGFTADRLRAITMMNAVNGSKEKCGQRFVQVLADLEKLGPPLNGAQPAWESSGQKSEELKTDGGSLYRRYVIGNANQRFAATSPAPHVMAAQALFIAIDRDEGGCIVTVRARNDFGEGPDISALPAAPSADDFSRAIETKSIALNYKAMQAEQLWPRFALENEIEGAANVDCIVQADRSLRCRLASETPAGMGFGAAALYRVGTATAKPETDGGPAIGAKFTRTISFKLSR